MKIELGSRVCHCLHSVDKDSPWTSITTQLPSKTAHKFKSHRTLAWTAVPRDLPVAKEGYNFRSFMTQRALTIFKTKDLIGFKI